jgi:FkbM family methyltransferase
MKKIIFDLGANEGQNIEYYLTKADLVVAAEANPILAKKIRSTFNQYIEQGKLIVFNNCIVDNKVGKLVEFYKHKTDSGSSRFSKPKRFLNDFEVIMVEPITYQEIVTQVGNPYYVKIDLEGLDYLIYNSIIESGIIPKYLSFENGTSYSKKLLTENIIFKSFNIVSFYNYAKIYSKVEGRTAGPFANDIKSPWLNQSSIIELYNSMPTAWFDIHLCTEQKNIETIDFNYYKNDFNLILTIKQMVPHSLRKIINTLRNKEPN